MNRFYCATIYCPADPDGQIFVLYANRENLEDAISGFRRKVNENCVFLAYYAASSGNSLPTFPDNLSVPSSGVIANSSHRAYCSIPLNARTFYIRQAKSATCYRRANSCRTGHGELIHRGRYERRSSTAHLSVAKVYCLTTT